MPAEETKQYGLRPARSVAEREKQLMALAVDLSEKRLREGTASSAEIVYWLKQASPQAQLERTNMEMQSKLLEAKIKDIESNRENGAAFAEAINAMRGYQPSPDDFIEGDYEEM